jgi:phosphoenolpyruvate synthase/pyruvate phosphate dikinase
MNIYIFGDGQAEGKAEMKNLLGGNEANLAEMTSTGLPVPPGIGTLKESGHSHGKIFFIRIIS